MRIALFLITGCAGGALHQATLVGRCAENDVACSRRHPLAPIAVGARFVPEISAEQAGTTTPDLRLESAAPDVIAVDGNALVAMRPGAAAILISTDDGSVVDFLHVWAAPATSVTLARRDGDRVAGTLALAVGEDVPLVPALWNGAQRLSGDAEITWTASSEAPVAVLYDGSLERRRLRARAPGHAKLTVALADTRETLDVEVVP